MQEYNEHIFGGQLPADLEIGWNNRLSTTAGLTHYRREVPPDPAAPPRCAASKLESVHGQAMAKALRWMAAAKELFRKASRIMSSLSVTMCCSQRRLHLLRRCAALCLCRYSARVELSSKVLDALPKLERTLAHELCHVAGM